MAKIESWQLKQRQSLSLKEKIQLSKVKIRDFYNYFDGNVYVSFSGGKDSTVLLHLIRSIYPNIPAVFADTGLEYPEIKEFVRSTNNVTWLKPKLSFRQVLGKHGYPVMSKENAQKVYEIRTTKSEKLLYKRLHGDNNKYKSGKLPEKWKYMIDAPFKISHFCCNIMKKNPFKIYERKNNVSSFIGVMASDSKFRRQQYLRVGCNMFSEKRSMSQPLAFWLEDDIWNYLKKFSVSYSKIYDMGYERTGCVFCMFGVHLEKEPNRFQRMKNTHPKLYNYCMNNLDLRDVLKYIGVDYE